LPSFPEYTNIFRQDHGKFLLGYAVSQARRQCSRRFTLS